MTCNGDSSPVQLCSLDALRRVLADLKGRRVTLMGLGVFGGGEGAARFLLDRGAELTVTDLRTAEKLRSPLERLAGPFVRLRLGEHVEEDFVQADLLVASPAVPRTSPFLRAAGERGVLITSPMNMFLALCPAPVCAVTGSNGKSTTASLIAAILGCADRKVWLGGNIGKSLLPAVSMVAPGHLVVLELSSFQLQDAAALRRSPHLAVVTNITPDHMDRHGGLEEYAEAKRTIVRFQGPSDFAVLNARDPVQMCWVSDGLPAQVIFFDAEAEAGKLRHGVNLLGDRFIWHNSRLSEFICMREEVPLLGLHNTKNVMAAAAAARCLGALSSHVRGALRSFVGLEHRLELVGQFNGVRVYNDSYSTTPEAGVAAVDSFPGAVTLIAGGYDKKLDLHSLARAAARSVEVLITLGQTGPALAQKVRQESLHVGRPLLIREASSLEEAVRLANSLSMPGSAVVFSPACASYDMFDNYEHRGRVFKDLVKATFRA